MGKKKEEPNKLSLWVWLLAVGSLIALTGFLFLLSELEPNPREPKTKPPTEEALNSTRDQAYGFYERLKDTVVPITVDPGSLKKSKSVDDAIFLLQVASFRSREDAEQVRAELMLLGLQPRIEESETEQGATWYRIMAGPFPSRSKLQKARNVLLSNRYEAMLIKRKPEKSN